MSVSVGRRIAAGALRAALAEPARSCVVVPAANTVPAGIAIAAALAAQVPVFPLNPATPPAERDATPDGFATVGDHGRLDSGGYLYLAPREHETINVGGEKVDPDEVETGLAAHCGTRLAGYKIPKHYTFIDQVPRTAAGKIQRWRLAPPHENGATTS